MRVVYHNYDPTGVVLNLVLGWIRLFYFLVFVWIGCDWFFLVGLDLLRGAFGIRWFCFLVFVRIGCLVGFLVGLDCWF